MSLGFDRELNIINLGDTATVIATLYDSKDTPLTADQIESVNFTVQTPSLEREDYDGELQDDGTGLLRYEATNEVGQYLVVATFQLLEEKRSTRYDFEVVDPFTESDRTPEQVVGDSVWAKLEDCFDAEDEGPWLRD